MSIPTKNYGPEFLAALAADIPAPDGAPWADRIIDDLHALHDSELIKEIASGDALIRLDGAIAAVEEARDAALAAPAPQAADHSPDAGKKVGGDQAPAEDDLAEALTAELFDIGGNGPDDPCGRLQFMLGRYPDHERPNGGLNRHGLLRVIQEVIAKHQPKGREAELTVRRRRPTNTDF